MPETASIQITICMGSSCFSRGNNRNLEVIQEYLREHPLPSAVDLSGHLCQGHCQSGPNLTINGKMYHAANPVSVTGLLRHFAAEKK